MLTTSISLKAATSKKPAEIPKDESDAISADELSLVQAAMAAGLTEFTVPSDDADWKRGDWTVKQWVILRGGQPTSHLVANKVGTSIEIFGPEIPLGTKLPNGLKDLQKRNGS